MPKEVRDFWGSGSELCHSEFHPSKRTSTAAGPRTDETRHVSSRHGGGKQRRGPTFGLSGCGLKEVSMTQAHGTPATPTGPFDQTQTGKHSWGRDLGARQAVLEKEIPNCYQSRLW